ncbi:hypothetical protein FHG66_02890 [Rubellimicrobium rubrum]|uniref:Uncharacterized protein n=1 Tax=Rubellimicrobium rubrum TaxID=2585369 RepID=A0A5C4N4G6_9RHOB|nr:hypothetical protein [Rubellimicrobium rubrum]TNC52496.1 hypothetical protein FHG66_02890 [Rubellimicrobium rubrum]
MTRLALLLLPFLAACAAPGPDSRGGDDTSGGFFGSPEAEAAAPEPLPPQVLAALPAGVPPSVAVRNGDGCYLLSIEVTDPPSGFPLTDAAGNQICDRSPVATVSGDEAVGDAEFPALLPGDIKPPAPIAPLNPT